MESRYIPDDIIEQIRERCDIADLIGSYIPLTKRGKDFWALCPFHNEKTPSFTVNPERNAFHCFGCGKGGDIFRFVMDKENVDFPQAVHLIAQRYHIHIPETPLGGNTPEDRQAASKRRNQRERLYALYDQVCKWYHHLLKSTDSAVGRYLANRGIPGDIVDSFMIGASPDSWDATLTYCQQQGFSRDEILTAGLAKPSDRDPSKIYDRFRNRLMFPIWNEQGKVVAFSARTIDPEAKEAKYINSPETPLFTKSKVLYALPLARQGIQEKGFSILCEGQLDVIAMHRAGFTNAVAPQGTAFTHEQARILKRYSDCVCLAFDSDSAGIKASVKAFDLAVAAGLEVKVISFPADSDPDEIFKTQGEQGLIQVVNGAMDFLDYFINVNFRNINRSSSWDVNRAIGMILDHIAIIDSSITRAVECSKIAQYFQVPEKAVFNELNKRRRHDFFRGKGGSQQRGQQNAYRNHGNGMTSPPPDPADPAGNMTGGMDQQAVQARKPNSLLVKAEKALLELALAHGTVGERLSRELPHELISDTSVGQALDEVIKMTLDGEWEKCPSMLMDRLNQQPDPILSSILSNPVDFSHEQQEKAVSDCLMTIRRCHLQQEISTLTGLLRQTQDEQEKGRILLEYKDKKEALKQLLKRRA